MKEEKKTENIVGLTREEFLKVLGTGLVVAGLGQISGTEAYAESTKKENKKEMATSAAVSFPTRDNPLVIDEKKKRVLIYTEVNEMNVHQYNVHWGVVFKDGRFQDRAILQAYANQLDFHDALVKIGARPGNNLNKETVGSFVEGDTLDVRATQPGLGKELSLNDIFFDEKGKPFQIKFGGNRKASEEQKTGCITCLESCWISISSNAQYPQTGAIKRFISPNSRFKGKAETLPSEGKPVILIYSVANGKRVTS
jgi:hypothetical protein